MTGDVAPLVVEVGGDAAVGFAGRLLARSGLRVVKLELLPDGDPTRREGSAHRAPDRTDSAGTVFHYLNQGKRSVALDPGIAEGRRLIAALVARADAVLVDEAAAHAAGIAGLVGDSARRVRVWVSPYGRTGPRGTDPAEPATVFAAAGEASMLPGGLGYRLNPDGPPLVARGHLVDSDTGVVVAMCAAAALRGGEPVSVDVAKQECEASLNRWLVTHYVASGWIESRATRAYAFAGLMECRDGFVMLQPTTDGHWAGLKAMLGDPEWAEAPEFATQDLRLQAGKAIQERLAEWARGRTKAEIFELALANNVPGAPFRTMPDVAECPQFAARGFVVDYGPGGRLPGLPFAAHPAATVDGGSAPDLGQDNDSVLGRLDDVTTTAGAP